MASAASRNVYPIDEKPYLSTQLNSTQRGKARQGRPTSDLSDLRPTDCRAREQGTRASLFLSTLQAALVEYVHHIPISTTCRESSVLGMTGWAARLPSQHMQWIAGSEHAVAVLALSRYALAQEGHKEAEADEDHNMDVLIEWVVLRDCNVGTITPVCCAQRSSGGVANPTMGWYRCAQEAAVA